MRKVQMFCWVLVLALAMAAVAQQPVTQVLAPDMRVPSKTTQQVSFELPQVSSGQQVRLSVDARVDWPGLDGNNPFMVVTVNDHALTLPDLMNKPPEFTMNDGSETTWAFANSWRLVYAPDFSDTIRTADIPFGIRDVDPYHFVWNITPYAHQGRNTVTFFHPQLLQQPTTVVMRDVTLAVGPPIPSLAGDRVEPAPTGDLPVYVARGVQRVNIDGLLSADGGLHLQVAGQALNLVTRISEPNGAWRSTSDGVSAGGSNLVARRTVRVTWQGTGYRALREVQLYPDHVGVRDTFTNSTQALVGIMVRNMLLLPTRPKHTLLAGRPAYSQNQRTENAAHPTALAVWDQLSVGLAAEDDIYRAHIVSLTEPGAVGLADDQLALQPGKPVTLEWSIYPQPGGGYWSFVNALRRNWGANFQIPALATFDFSGSSDGSKSSEFYCRWAQSRGAGWLLSTQTDYKPGEITPEELEPPQWRQQYINRPASAYVPAEGTGILHGKKWIQGANNWISKMHQCASHPRTLLYIHTQICTEPYHYELYKDDMVLDPNGQPMQPVFYYPLNLYLPTPENTYGKALLKAVGDILDTTGADGFYNDEMDWSTTTYTYNPKMWDGCTAIINGVTHELAGKRSSVILLQQPWKVEFINLLRRRGKVLIGNSQPSTRTLLNLHLPRFVETASYSFLIDGHLNSPLGLGNHHSATDEPSRARMVRRFLDQASLMTVYWWEDEPVGQHYMRLMFPITPQELHPGMVMGKERIVTNRSGLYGWPDGRRAQVYVFNGEGKYLPGFAATEVKRDGHRLVELRMPSDHFAVLVKR